MTMFGLILIAFLVSLFIGSSKVCWGLGITLAIIIFANLLDSTGWLDK